MTDMREKVARAIAGEIKAQSFYAFVNEETETDLYNGDSNVSLSSVALADAAISAIGYEELVSEITRLRSMLEWSPIETAPKDPSRYMILRCARPTPNHTCVGVWMYSHWKAIHSEERLEPTHWLPLPPAPEVQT